MVGAGIPGKNSLAGIEEKFVSLSQDEDKSYANLGNKRVTEADFENYRQSIGDESGASKRTYIPGSVGEKLRRETTGEIGSQSYRGKVKNDDDMKKAQSKFVKRLIVAALLFLLPLIINFVLQTFGFYNSGCDITDLL